MDPHALRKTCSLQYIHSQACTVLALEACLIAIRSQVKYSSPLLALQHEFMQKPPNFY